MFSAPPGRPRRRRMATVTSVGTSDTAATRATRRAASAGPSGGHGRDGLSTGTATVPANDSTARVDGLLDSRKGALKIPLAAVFEEMGSDYAYIQEAKGKHRRAKLKLGLRNETDVEVLDGLKEGEQVATEKPEEGPGKPAAGK